MEMNQLMNRGSMIQDWLTRGIDCERNDYTSPKVFKVLGYHFLDFSRALGYNISTVIWGDILLSICVRSL